MEERRVIVTGIGVVSPVGNSVKEAWASLIAGESGIGPISLFDAEGFAVSMAGEVRDLDPAAEFGRYRAKHLDRFTQLGIIAARQAVDQSGLDAHADPYRVGVIVGSGAGGMATMQRQADVLTKRGPAKVSPYMTPMMIANMAAGEIAMEFGAMGVSGCPVTACAASANAIGDSFEAIRSGRADVVIAGGAEAAVLPLCVAGFGAMKAVADVSRPFDVGREGFVIAEGAAILVLEERERAIGRGAPILGEVLGYGTTCDAHHPTAPHPEGAGARAAMASAITQSGLHPAEIDYVNAHGTSTPHNDAAEARAIADVVGVPGDRDVAVSSTKSMTGHLLGAAGAFEAMAALQSIEAGIVPPTINLERLDPECDVPGVRHIANTAVEMEVRHTMSNSFGFGGHNVSLILGSGLED